MEPTTTTPPGPDLHWVVTLIDRLPDWAITALVIVVIVLVVVAAVLIVVVLVAALPHWQSGRAWQVGNWVFGPVPDAPPVEPMLSPDDCQRAERLLQSVETTFHQRLAELQGKRDALVEQLARQQDTMPMSFARFDTSKIDRQIQSYDAQISVERDKVHVELVEIRERLEVARPPAQ